MTGNPAPSETGSRSIAVRRNSERNRNLPSPDSCGLPRDRVTWLLLKQPEDARPYLEELCQRAPEIATCASQVREFCRIVRQRGLRCLAATA